MSPVLALGKQENYVEHCLFSFSTRPMLYQTLGYISQKLMEIMVMAMTIIVVGKIEDRENPDGSIVLYNIPD